MLTKQCWDEHWSCRSPSYLCVAKEHDTLCVSERIAGILPTKKPLLPSCEDLDSSLVVAKADSIDDLEAPVAKERSGPGSPAWSEANAVRSEFVITIDRSQVIQGDNGKLGVDIDDSDNKTLVIQRMKPGLIYNWNMSHPMDVWVLHGDSIIECNGVSGDAAQIYEECSQRKVLTMKIQPAPHQRTLPVCQTDDNQVTVHVYDLWGCRSPIARLWNNMTTRFGAFHTGVEVYGVEFCFSANPNGEFEGLCTMNTPGCHECHSYRKSIPMGRTSLPRVDLESVLPQLRMAWPGWRYDMIRRNCHRFTDAFCKVLGFRAGPKCGLFGVGDPAAACLQRQRESIADES